MEPLLQFVIDHALLSAAIVGVTVAIIVNEAIQFRTGGRSVEPGTATRMYNKENALFVDIRGENAYLTAHLPGSINVPVERIDQNAEKLNRHKGRPIIVYGEPGRGVGRALKSLKGLGLDPVYELRGGLPAWQDASLPTEGRRQGKR